MRLDGWEIRLADIVNEAARKPYVLGEHDCLRLACASVEALTGEDFWPRFVGYKTKRQALMTIARIAPSLQEAVTVVLETPSQPVLMSGRGDLLLYADKEGEHLSVCLGAYGAVLGPEGLHNKLLNHTGFICGWRIG